MAKLNIIKDGDPLLRKKCRAVDEITPRIRTLLDDMTETMRDANGCGLAAPQIGVLRRIVVIEVEEGTVPPHHQEAGRAAGDGGLSLRSRQIRHHQETRGRNGGISRP